MSPLAAVVALVAIAAVTPGPNNFIVLRTASRAGVRGALPAIAGVVVGSLALLAIATVASDVAFSAEPRLRMALGAAGCLYLSWLGLGLIRDAGRPSTGEPRGLPAASLMGLFAFQILNPKSWVMVMTAIGAMPAGQARWPLGVVFTVIPTSCLLLWATAGAALARWLARPRIGAWVDRVMGVLLIATAIALLELP
jgi:threonine/homoserine/homoserine lactone efflux protein